nr:MAG: hypothetical protein [Microviridae sp.]
MQQQNEGLGISPTNATQADNSESLSEQTTVTAIANTPFHTVGNEKSGYGVTFGKYILTTPAATPEEAEAKLSTNFWEILIGLISIVPDILKEVYGTITGTEPPTNTLEK